MACPYFIPTAILAGDVFAHRNRLPLGNGYRGYCCAASEQPIPADDELIQHCNLGHARRCSRLPHDRAADAVRFSLGRERNGHVSVHFVMLREQLPVNAGVLEYDLAQQRWMAQHSDQRIQRQAEAFLSARGKG